MDTAENTLRELRAFEIPVYIPNAKLTGTGFAAAVTRDAGDNGEETCEITRFTDTEEQLVETLCVNSAYGEGFPSLCGLTDGSFAVTNGLASDGAYGFKVFDAQNRCTAEYRAPADCIFSGTLEKTEAYSFCFTYKTEQTTNFVFCDVAGQINTMENPYGFTQFLASRGDTEFFCKTEFFENGSIEKQTVFAVKNGERLTESVLSYDCTFYPHNRLFADIDTVYVLNRARQICTISLRPDGTIASKATKWTAEATAAVFPYGNGRLLKLDTRGGTYRLYDTVGN